MNLRKLKNFFFEKRIGFYFLTVILFLIKTDLTYLTKFNLGAQTFFQKLIMFLNPLASALFLLVIGLFFKGRKSYIIILVIDFLMTTLLFANILYYREFSDFLTIEVISKSAQNANGLGGSIVGIFKISDLLVYLDLVILLILIFTKVIKLSSAPLKIYQSFTLLLISLVVFCSNISLAYTDRDRKSVV